jgi:hypothetical protein
MCLGCPNHASYRAITCGEEPVARYFNRTGVSDAEFKQPCGAKRKSRSEIAKRFSINKELEAIILLPVVRRRSSQAGVFRIGLIEAATRT